MLNARPENQILICVGRRSLDDAAAANLCQLLQRDLNWNYLMSMAERHRLIPSLHYHLSRESSNEVPAKVRSRLEQLNNDNARSNLLLTGELLKLIDLLEARGIVAVPFKGPTLALLAYGDVGRREFGDLDILVKKQDIPATIELLEKKGFTPKPTLTARHKEAILRFDCSHNFANDKDVWIDVHWDFASPTAPVRFDPSKLWERLEPISVNNRELKTVSVEDLLLILCLHGFTHFWEKLGWICDVAALVGSQEKIDWATVVNSADRMGSRRVLSLGLYLASNLLRAAVPADVWAKVPADDTVVALAEEIQQALFTDHAEPLGILNEVRIHLAMREEKRDKLASFVRLLATPRVDDWRLLPLPGSLFFLYYALRPIRLAAKYAGKLLRVSADRETLSKTDERVVF